MADDKNRRFIGAFSVGEVLQVLTFVGACSYGAGWVFASYMFSPFGLQPDDVGINGEFLIVRAGLVVGASGLLLSLLYVVARPTVLKFGRRGNSVLMWPLVGFAQVAYLTLATGLLAIIIHYARVSLPLALAIILALALGSVLTYFEGALLMEGLGMGLSSEPGPALKPNMNPMAAVGALFFWFLLVLPAAVVAGLLVGQSVHKGLTVDTPFISVRQVTAYVSSTITAPSDPRAKRYPDGHVEICGLDLGSNGQSVVIWDPRSHELLTLPVDYTSLLDGPGSCP